MNSPMTITLTTLILSVMTIFSFVACVLATIRIFAQPQWPHGIRKIQYSLTGICTAGCVILFLLRALFVHQGWQPLRSHVDGLLLIISLFSGMILFLQWQRVRGLATFALPLLTVTLAWAVCASAWTFQWFEMDSLWKVVHRLGVYLGAIFFMIAGTAGVMFLYVRRGLRDKHATVGRGQLASLETIEHLIVWTSALGFGLLSVGIIMGLIEVTSGPTKLGPLWWQSPKILLAVTVWLIYAIVMSAHRTPVFRGAGAAWLSIAGLVLLLAVFGIARSQMSHAKIIANSMDMQVVGAR